MDSEDPEVRRELGRSICAILMERETETEARRELERETEVRRETEAKRELEREGDAEARQAEEEGKTAEFITHAEAGGSR